MLLLNSEPDRETHGLQASEFVDAVEVRRGAASEPCEAALRQDEETLAPGPLVTHVVACRGGLVPVRGERARGAAGPAVGKVDEAVLLARGVAVIWVDAAAQDLTSPCSGARPASPAARSEGEAGPVRFSARDLVAALQAVERDGLQPRDGTHAPVAAL